MTNHTIITFQSTSQYSTTLCAPLVPQHSSATDDSGVKVRSWSRYWPNCVTMWVRRGLDGLPEVNEGEWNLRG